jgi:transglutaminase-like putative cysteine protease
MRSTLRAAVRLSLALLAPAIPAALAAQAPVITTAGDPSVKADSIYKLAVNAADFPDETSRFLLDDGVVQLERNGTGKKTYRQVVQVLRPEGVENWQEMQFSYAPRHERFTLNWIRVVKPDGTVISDKPSHLQESDVPAQMGDPIYSDRKVIRASVTGVAPGTIVDFSYTTEELKPFLEGDDFITWGVSTGLAVGRSRYIVDVPADVKLRIKEQNLNFKRVEKVANGRRTITWATKDLPLLKPEAWAADSNGVYMSVLVALPTTWAGIGKWYADNAKDRYVLTPEVEEKLRSLVARSGTLDDSIRAVHRWVAQDVRYVSIALGLGGYQPRPPAEVLTSGFGDCKDKATIFVAMMNRMGLTAYPVILNSTGGVERELPSITQFDHAIAAFKRPGRAGYEFVDLTASLTPLGELPFGPQGEFGIVVHPDGKVEEVTFPLTTIADNRFRTVVTGTLSEDGTFDGRYEEHGFGNRQYDLRNTFENPLDSAAREQLANKVASSWFTGADGDSLVTFDGRDLGAAPRISLLIKGGRAASIAGNNAILQNPLGAMGNFTAGAKELDAQPPRLFPIEPLKIFGYQETQVEIRVTLPTGWTAQLPPTVEASGPFGTYRSTYAQVGRDLIVKRTVAGAKGIQGPDKRAALTAWMREIGKDNAPVIVIDRKSGQSPE